MLVSFRRLIAMMLAVGLAGCTGENAFIVRGRITDVQDAAYRSCWISVYQTGGVLVDHSDDINDIKGRFKSTFIVAPASRDYYFTLGCKGTGAVHETQVYRIGADRFENPIDLGQIILERP